MPRKNTRARDIFNAFARQAERDFPRLRDRLVLVDAQNGGLYGSARAARGAEDSARAHAWHARRAHASTVCHDKARGLYFITYNGDGPDDPRDVSAAEREAMLDDLLHEAGHLVVPGAYYAGRATPQDTRYRAETGAILFSMLQHMRRNGPDSPLLDRFFEDSFRAFAGGAPRPSYVAGHALQYAADNSRALGLDALTPRETARLAAQIARDHTPPLRETRRMMSAFSSFRRAFAKSAHARQHVGALRKIAQVMRRNPDDPQIERTGVMLLRPFLDRRAILGESRLPLLGPEWRDIRALAKKPQGPAR